MGLSKAKISSLDEKGKTTQLMSVQFNPDTYSLTRNISYSKEQMIQKDVTKAPQFIKSDPYSFSVDLLFDTSRSEKKEGVRSQIKLFKACIYAEDNNKKVIPKQFRFAWGTFCFKGVITSFSESYTMFHSNGEPARVKVSISATGDTEEIKYDSSSEVDEEDMSGKMVTSNTVKAGNPRLK